MTLDRVLLIATAFMAVASLPAFAHSLKDFEDQMMASEPYFQPVDLVAPDFVLQDAAGKRVALADLRDKVVVLNFIYASCTDICPLHSELIAQLQRMVNESSMKDHVAFISITTDPSHDRGKLLSDYGNDHGLDPMNWSFLTSPADAPEDSTRMLAKAYGLEFTPMPDGQEVHGVVTHVIDREGHLRARFHGMQFGTANFVTFVSALVNDVHPKPSAAPEEPQSFWSWLSGLVSPVFGGAK